MESFAWIAVTDLFAAPIGEDDVLFAVFQVAVQPYSYSRVRQKIEAFLNEVSVT